MFVFIGNGGKAALRAGWDEWGRDGKSHGKRSPHQGSGPNDMDLSRISQQKWIFGGKKPKLELKNKVLWKKTQSCRKRQQFVERPGWVFCQPIAQDAGVLKNQLGNLGTSRSLAFPTWRGKFPGDVPPPSRTRHDTNSHSQPACKKKAIFECF